MYLSIAIEDYISYDFRIAIVHFYCKFSCLRLLPIFSLGFPFLHLVNYNCHGQIVDFIC